MANGLYGMPKKTGILNYIFPNISIISAKRRTGIGDVGYIISYKIDGKYRQKVIIFEIKHGRIWVKRHQFEKYCRIITQPEIYFPKADEVKIVFMMFNGIDIKNKTTDYSLRELDKELAHKFLENENDKTI